MDKILRVGRYHQRSYLHRLCGLSVEGFLGGGGSKFPFFIDFDYCKNLTKFQRFTDFFRWLLRFICLMSAIFLLPVCLTYWLRKYTTRVAPHVDNSHQVWSLCDHQLPRYSVLVRRYVTWPCDLDLCHFDLRCHTWRVTWHTSPPSMKTLHLSVPQLWVIKFSVSYLWKCVCGHCACAESPNLSREQCVKNNYIFVCSTLICLFTMQLRGSTMKIIKVICENNARPVLKDVWDFAHARNHMICLRWPKCLIAVDLDDVDLQYWISKVEHIVSFTAIFSNIVLRMRRNGYLWTSGVNLDTAVWFVDPDFLLECNILAIWRRFPFIFAFDMLNVRHISTSGLFDLLS